MLNGFKKYLCLFFLFCLSFNVFAADSTPLPVDKAFQLSVSGVSDQGVRLHWEIAPGYHLYKDRLSFSLAAPKNAEIGQITLPKGIAKQDDILGKYEVYIHTLDLTVPFNNIHHTDEILLVSYQGCSERNFCYPPVTKRITFNLEDTTRLSIDDHSKAMNTSMEDRFTHLLEEKNYFWICLAFIGFGILLAFTPCVLPMIPILSSIIVGQRKENLTMRRAFFVSLAYVLGMSFAYAAAGVLVALAGSHLIILFSLLFVLLALSLFGLYDLQLPQFIHHRVVHLSNRQKSGSYVGAFVMGVLSVLIVSPCVTAPLVGVLTFIAQTGDIVLGSTALFSLGFGMGLPLLVIGTTEGKFLPKSGAWMNVVKSAFGVLLIAMAIYLLGRIVPGYFSLMLWAALFIILAVYLGWGTTVPRRVISSGWVKFGRGLGLLSFCYGVILLVGAAMGNSDPIHPLRVSTVSSSTTEGNLIFQPVKTIEDVNAAILSAKRQGKAVMLDFYAEWCVSCHEMDKNTFNDPAVKTILKNWVLLRADVTANDSKDRALENYFKVVAPPTVLFFDESGKELLKSRVVGAVPPKDFLDNLQRK
jgi:thiol:disulfide interchange protein DsbD